MPLLNRLTITALCALLLVVAVGWTECTKQQKQAVADFSVAHLCQLLDGKSGLAGDLGAGACSYQKDPSEANYEHVTNAVNVALARHDLSATERQIAQTVEEIIKYFAPATFAEMDPNSEDARAAKKEIKEKFKQLEKLVKE